MHKGMAHLPEREGVCCQLGIIAMGWSIEVVTWVEYVIRTPQGSEKHILGFKSCSKPQVTQQEFAWSETAAMPRWTSSIRPAGPKMGAVALKRSRDPNSLPTPSKQLPPQQEDDHSPTWVPCAPEQGNLSLLYRDGAGESVPDGHTHQGTGVALGCGVCSKTHSATPTGSKGAQTLSPTPGQTEPGKEDG